MLMRVGNRVIHFGSEAKLETGLVSLSRIPVYEGVDIPKVPLRFPRHVDRSTDFPRRVSRGNSRTAAL